MPPIQLVFVAAFDDVTAAVLAAFDGAGALARARDMTEPNAETRIRFIHLDRRRGAPTALVTSQADGTVAVTLRDPDVLPQGERALVHRVHAALRSSGLARRKATARRW